MDVWVAYDGGARARWALELGADLARRSAGRLTLAHVAPPSDEPEPNSAAIAAELLALSEDARRRRQLDLLVRAMAPDVHTEIRVSTGQPVQELLDMLHHARPDVVVAGTRSGSGIEHMLVPDLGRALLHHARCPVLVIREQPDPGRRPVLLLCGRIPEAVWAIVRQLASGSEWRALHCPVPERRGDREQAERVLATCREHRPALAVVAGQRCPTLRGALAWSRAETLVDIAPCPVLVVPRDAFLAPPRERMVSGGEPPPPPMSSQLLTDTQPARRPRPRARVFRSRQTLQWQLFAATALILLVATLLLIFTPVRISSQPVLSEVLSVTAGLAVMLGIHLFVLRRRLAPLRLLTDTMGAIDPHHPGQRVPDFATAGSEVAALGDAFNAMLDRLEDERRRSARRALAAQEDERLRIAQEMHDQIGQTLTAVTLQAERAAQTKGPVDREVLEQIARSALQSLDDVRRIGRELRPEALDDLGLGSALIALSRRMAAQSGIRVVHRLESGIPPLAPEVELVVYRIAQESLTNAIRHAAASRIEVRLACSANSVELAVTDDGCGMPDTIGEDTAGLSGMRERALLIGGSLSLRSGNRRGTQVHLTVPLEAAVRS